MKKRGLRLALLGLILGVGIGGIIKLQIFVARELLGVLEGELKASVPCSLQYDSANMSFLTLNAWAKNARVVCDGDVRLRFDRITASFSLSDISNRRIILDELRLINGVSQGVGPDSTTYKFIDYLSAPIKPEHDTPDRWRISLMSLVVKNSQFVEHFTSSLLIGEGAELSMHRTESDDVLLSAKIGSLKYRMGRGAPRTGYDEISFGEAKGEVEITDDKTIFNTVTVALGSAWSRLSGAAVKKLGNALSGDSQHSVSLPYLGLPEWLPVPIEAKCSVGGSLESPTFTGSFNLPENKTGSVFIGPFPIATFDSLDGHLDFDLNHRNPLLTIPTLTGGGPEAKVSLREPIKIKDDKISGKLDLEIGSASLGPAIIRGIQARVELGGAIDNVKASVIGNASSIEMLNVMVPNAAFKVGTEGELINVGINSEGATGGRLSLDGQIDTSGKQSLMKDFKIITKDIPFPDPMRSSGALGPVLNSEGTLSGPFELDKLNMNLSGAVQVGSADRPISIPAHLALKDGKLNVSTDGTKDDLKFSLNMGVIDQSKGALSLKLNNFDLASAIPKLSCGTVSGSLAITFPGTAIELGSGDLSIEKADVGCDPYIVRLDKQVTFPITNGAIKINETRLTGFNNSVNISGAISIADGFSLKGGGSLPIGTLAALLPAFDDLSGALSLTFGVAGPLGAPKISAEGTVQEGGFSIEDANISSESITGTIKVVDNQVKLESLKGLVNGGAASVTGMVDPADLARTAIRLSFEDVLLEPSNDASILLDGDLTLGATENLDPVVRGVITIQSGEFRRNIDLISILRALTQLIFSAREVKSSFVGLPAVGLDLDVRAPGGLFIFTNFLEAELRAKIRVGGTLAAPWIDGAMETLSGWFGFRDRRFDITSGTIRFRPDQSEPFLDVIGESGIKTRTGDDVNVVIEAKGPLSSPQMELTSDSPMTQRELLALIAEGTSASGQTLVNTPDSNFEGHGYSLSENVPILSYSRFINELTRIDSLSLEPRYNVNSGLVEPWVIARKKLLDRLTLIGESSFGGTVTESKLGAVYNVTPKLNAEVYTSSVTTQEGLSVGADLIYTVLANQVQFASITVIGNDSISRSDILSSVRLTESTHLRKDGLSRISKGIGKLYHSSGYFDTTVEVTCTDDGDYCREITIRISEGVQSKILGTRFDGDSLDQIFGSKKLPKADTNATATLDTLRDLKKDLIKKLRSEGFIAAKVTTKYVRKKGDDDVTLVVESSIGRPVSFSFIGNKSFSAKDFLDTINLFDRKQPFGNNTINILIRNIERKYREAGFIYATIQTNQLQSPESDRLQYVINIDEGQLTRVTKVSFVGNEHLNSKALRSGIKKMGPELLREIFSPRYAIEEQLERNSSTIRDVYVNEGYPDAKVEAHIVPDELGEQITIKYQITEGNSVVASMLKVTGMPNDVQIPAIPEPPISIPSINSYIISLGDLLKGSGFKQESISVNRSKDDNSVLVETTPGERTKIASIEIEGNQSIAVDAIRKYLPISEGESWTEESISETKRKLLRLGLFSRVEVDSEEVGATPNVEKLRIKVTEKPLQTLDLGIGANSEYGLHLFGEGTDRGIFKDGKSLSLRLDVFFDSANADLTKGFGSDSSAISRGIAGIRYVDPSLAASNYSLTEDLRYQKIDTSTQEYTLDRVSLASYLYRIWESGLGLTAGHTILNENLSDVSPDAILSDLDSGNLTIGFISGSLTYDRRDNPLNPSSGYSANVEGKLAEEAFGSDADYYELGGKASYLYPFLLGDYPFTLAVAGHGASAWTFAGTPDLPISQRYYLGGRTSVRGFKENSLGPRGLEGSIIGGDSLVSTNLELQYRFAEAASVHTFLDAGNVYLRSLETDPLRRSTGVGIRYLSPIGPIGFDIGHPLDRREGESNVRFHFSIGSNF